MDWEPLLTEKRAAELLGVSVSWLQKGRCYGYGPPFIRLTSPRGAIRYRKADLERFIAENLHRPRGAIRDRKVDLARFSTDHSQPGPATK